MASLDKLINGRRKQRHTEFLFLFFSWDTDYHAANIFSSLVRDKFFALSAKWSNESGRDDFTPPPGRYCRAGRSDGVVSRKR
jgi:hypothetical protein